ncbi:DEAD/DEAH box helicase family protein [Collinsella aerofaciens]|uniref:helicase-related protein n=1 Tax=Collinsella aerofaciens TaxID=74426 RepID=UPI001D02BC6D|nr:helicase-related protein [Collinsella aerofaciens]MCB5366927.1 DEAD/DEAH box helicase family protein [Collinsella aerofaciens]
MKVIIGTMYTYVDFESDTLLQEKVHSIMHKEMGVKVDGAFYSRAYRAGVWDGITDFYDMKEDKFHTGLLQLFLSGMRKLKESDPTITYTIEDERPRPLLHHDSIDEEIVLGNGDEDPITLRDYQYEAVKKVFEEQVGIVNAATNSGKCVTKFSNLLTSEGIMTVEEFFNRAGYKAETKEEVVPYTGDIKLVNRYGKLEKPSHLTFNGMKPVRKIVTDSGLEEKVTYNHPLLVVTENGSFEWRKAEDIKVGDFLVTRLGDNVYGSDTTVANEEEAYYLGALFNTPNGVAKDKKIPQYIMEAPKNIQLAFLSGYLEYESAIETDKAQIEITSASKDLLIQIQLLLKNMGILATLREKEVRGHEQSYYGSLNIRAKYAVELLSLINFKTEQRQKQAKEVVTSGSKEIKSKMESLINEHLFFDEVTAIEECGKEPTFDVCMPETHSFIADSIVNHNTEIAAGVMQQVLPYLKRGERIAFFCGSKEIFHQSAERVKKRLNLKDKDIGKIGDGKFDIKNKKIVFVMIPTLVSALKDPKKEVKFTHKERVIKFIAEEIAPKFRNTANTRQLLRNYIKNCKLTTKVWESALEHLQYIAYDNRFNDKSAQMQLNKYVVEFEKIMEKKAKSKYKRYKETMDFIESIKVIINDECHHAKSDTWFNCMSLCENAQYRVGLTGTVDKKDKMGWMRLQALFADVIVKVSNDYLINRGVSSKPIIRVIPIREPRNLELINNYLEAYRLGIVENEERNNTIVKLVEAYKKRKPGGVLISVREIEHGNRILEKLREKGYDAEFIHGGSDSDHRENTLRRFSKGELKIMVASTIIDEGVDMKSIGCMILAAGGKSMRQQLQRIGRGLRLNGIDGNSVMVFDFMDLTNRFLKNHSLERISIFKEEKFDVKLLGQ